MPYSLPLNTMSLDEKIEAMETLWADLSKSPEELLSPSWHGDVLAQRDTDVQSGVDEYVDIETAIKVIEKELG